MKKEINLVVGNNALSAFGYQCVRIVGPSDKLHMLAFDVCPCFNLVNLRGQVTELLFYRDVLIIKDCDDYLPYCVPLFRGGVCRFYSLMGAKSAVSRYLKKMEVKNDL